MTASTNARVITTATRELSSRWNDLKESWNDSQSQKFEKEYLGELFSSVERAVHALEELDRIIVNARNQGE